VSDVEAVSGDDHLAGILDTPQAGPKVIRGMAIRGLGYAVSVLFGVVSAAIALRYLGVVDSGRLITVLAIVTIAGGISDVGLSSLALRDYATRQPLERDDAMRNMLGLRLALAVAGLLAATAFTAVAGYPAVMVLGTLVASSAVLVGVVQQNLAVPLSASLRLGWVTVLALLGHVGVAIGFIILSLVGAGLIAFYTVPTLALIPALVVTFMLVRRTVPVLPAWKLGVWRRTLRDILPYSVAALFYILYFRFAVISVSLLSSEEETGYYAASFRIIDVLTLAPALLVSSAFPLLARAGRDDLGRLHYAIGRLTQGILILGLWIALVVGLGASIAIDVVAGSDFEPAVDPLRIQAVALVGTSLVAVWGYGLLSLRRHRAIMFANVVPVAVAGGLSIALVPRFGAVGAAVALTAAELSLAAAYGLALGRSDAALLRRFGSVPRIVLAAGLALAVPVALGLGDVTSVLVATAIYAIALVVLRAVPSELKEALLGGLTGPPAA
jgi:O-antigen/teichoic acid export membrane protein